MRSRFSRVVKFAAVAAAVCGFAANAAGAWQYYKAGDAGNPTTVSCITDGNWVLPATVNATTGKITLSAGGINTKKVVAGEGVCDLRGVLFTLDGVDCRVTNLGNWHFYKYAGITEFYAEGIESLGGGMFASCPSLRKIDIEGTATSIPNSPWDYAGFAASCSALTNVSLRLPLTSIGTMAFFNDAALVSDIADLCSDKIRSVGKMAFMSCQNLTGHLKLIDVTSIGGQAFENCSKLNEITLISDALTATPGEVYGSNRGLFMGCSSATNITMRCPNLVTVDVGTFRGLSNLNGEIRQTCPPSVSSIGKFAYFDCAKFVGNLVLTNLHSIGTMAFKGTSGIREIYISGDIATLPDYDGTYNQSVFSNCGATNIVFETPGLTSLGNGSFNNAAVKTITVNSTNAVAVGHAKNAAGTPKFTAITVMGPAWTQASMDNMLLNIKAVDGAKACTIYVDPEKEWGDLFATDYTENEMANKPRKCLGVYVTAGGDRKAWVVNGVVRTGLKISFR